MGAAAVIQIKCRHYNPSSGFDPVIAEAAQSNDLFLSMKVGWSTRNGPLDWFWTFFQQTIGDPAQLLQLADLKVVSLLLHKTNRAEQRQLDCPSLGLWTGP